MFHASRREERRSWLRTVPRKSIREHGRGAWAAEGSSRRVRWSSPLNEWGRDALVAHQGGDHVEPGFQGGDVNV